MSRQALPSDVLTLCQELIAIDSINPFRCEAQADGSFVIDGNEGELLAYCEGYLRRGGFETQRQSCGGGRQNLLASKGAGERSLLLYAHLDTVEVKPGWSREEALTGRLAQKQVDGRVQEVLYGLGSNDMKGGLAVVLRAATCAQFEGYRLKVALGCDEEFWSLGSHVLSESEFLHDVAGVIVPELGESSIEPQPGKILVTLGRCGRAEYVIDVPGTGGHGAEPDREDRVNALSQAAHIALAIEEHSRQMPLYRPFEGHDEALKGSLLVTRCEGGEGLLSIPADASLIVNRVLLPHESPDSGLRELEGLLQKLRQEQKIRPVFRGSSAQELWPTVAMRPRPTPGLRPYLFQPDAAFVSSVLSCLQKHRPLQLGMGLSVADENRFGADAGLPVVVLGPRGENSHAAHEWVTVESLRQLETLYIDILEQITLT